MTAEAEHLCQLMWQVEHVLDQIIKFGENKYRRAHLDSLVWAIDLLSARYPDAVMPARAKLKSRVSDRMRRGPR